MMIEDLGLGIPEDSHAAYRLGMMRANLDARIEAFAAIRRAAAVARLADACDDHEMDLIADGARRAIRAAIGSEKT
jgi:hypothetical protein